MPNSWTTWQPTEAEPWDLRRVVHLYRRAGFAGTWEELSRDLNDGVETSVERFLLGNVSAQRVLSHEALQQTARLLGDSAVASGDVERLKAWWVFRMLQTPDPLQERLALMWHNHFATSAEKVTDLKAMREQNDLFRRHARGHFAELLSAVVKQPAMLYWLDANTNRRGNPNENLARELMELFTLGEGNYGEGDVREAARALTGWTVQRGISRFDEELHEPGVKRLFAESQSYSAQEIEDTDDLVACLLEHPATANRLAWRLCQVFFGEGVVSLEDQRELAAELRETELGIGHAVGIILRSRLFYSDGNIANRVLGPAEFVIGAVRSMNLLDPPPSTLLTANWMSLMDLGLFMPPNVFGWDEGRTWINSRTLVARTNFAGALCHGECHLPNTEYDPRALLTSAGKPVTEPALRAHLAALWFGEAAVEPRGENDVDDIADDASVGSSSLSRKAAIETTIQILSSPKSQIG